MCYQSVGAYFPCKSVIFDGLFFRQEIRIKKQILIIKENIYELNELITVIITYCK